ncbi:MAG: hypothetical protein K8F25_00205, partial [Fimbriimonadaceae bacterium]|nr:hypothetical protein [Alphaproteobacteria bacterium]
VILSGYTGLPENQIVNALMKKNGQAIAVLCRGLDFSVETFSIIVEMRRQRLKLKDSECIVLTEEYSASDAAGAKRTMRFVNVRNTAMQA